MVEAEKLFNQRDDLKRQIADIDNRLRTLRSAYMQNAGIWGISEERFRHEITRINA